MTVISSLFSGISGIVSNGSALSVAGDNIANMNTPGFKSSIPIFESALSQRVGEAEVGLGSRLATTSANFSQGAFSNSTRPTDLAIQGKGFFIVSNSSNETFYTRAGSLERNDSGDLVTAAGGFILQGYNIATDGTVSGTLDAINLRTVSSAPVETSTMTFSVNLDSNASVQAFVGTSFTNAEASSSFSVSQEIYDSLGNPHSITTYFNRTAANTWGYHTLVAGADLQNYSGAAGGTVILAQGVLAFDATGTLTTATPDNTGDDQDVGGLDEGDQVTPNNATYGIRWTGAQVVLEIDHDFGVDNLGASTGSGAVTTQHAAAESTAIAISQDGRERGELQSIEFTEDGTLRGGFSNGTSRDLFRIPLATFSNEEGLERKGSNLYAETAASGTPQPGTPGDSGLGTLRSFAVEQSNVDLATEFVRIITFQRAFQASARTVSTAAELLQDLVNLGR